MVDQIHARVKVAFPKNALHWGTIRHSTLQMVPSIYSSLRYHPFYYILVTEITWLQAATLCSQATLCLRIQRYQTPTRNNMGYRFLPLQYHYNSYQTIIRYSILNATPLFAYSPLSSHHWVQKTDKRFPDLEFGYPSIVVSNIQ
jgi:hypothetical protein